MKFLSNLNLTCGDLDAQMQRRTKLRNEEISAVSEAVSIITDDDNRESLAKTTFVQLSSKTSTSSASKRQAAMKVLSRNMDQNDDLLAMWENARDTVGKKAVVGQQKQLGTLLLSMSLDSFTKVKEAMDKMVIY